MSFVETAKEMRAVKQAVVKPVSQLKFGDYVKVNPKEPATGENSVMAAYRKKEYVGKITYVDGYEDGFVHVQFPACEINSIPNAFMFRRKDLVCISNEEYAKVESLMKQEMEKAIAEKVKELEGKISAKRVPILKRPFEDIGERNFLNTNLNYLCFYTGVDSEGMPTGKATLSPDAVCCSVTKTTSSILVNIPKEWLSYYGYSLVDLKMWLAFLRGCEGLDFKAKYIGTSTLGEIYKELGRPIQARMPLYDHNNIYVYPDMECFQVMINGMGKKNMENYMNFIAIRYMYNSQYWNIPNTAMQLSRTLGEKITNWEALLIAHMAYEYNGYYCLTANQHGKVAVPNKSNAADNVRKGVTTPTNPPNMNNSFTYTSENSDLIKKALKGKDYSYIENLLKKWRK